MGKFNYQKKNKYPLVLSSSLKSLKFKSKKILSLNFHDNTNFLIKTIPICFPSKKKKEILEVYGFCNRITKNLINDLFLELNKVHSLNFSKIYWQFIIENWVYAFVKNNLKIYNQLDYIFKNYNISEVLVKKKIENFTFKDSLDFEKTAMFSEEWYNLLQVKIIRYFNFCKKIKIYSQKKNEQTTNVKKVNIKNLVLHFGNKIFNFLKIFFKFNSYAVIKHTYLPFRIEKFIELKLLQIPSFWSNYKIKYHKLNKNLRKKIDLKKNKDFSNFENFLRDILVDYIPMSFLENFEEIQKISKKYPKNPKFIFTSNSHYYDEIFKVYIANKKENLNSTIFFGQHGGNYFSSIHASNLGEIFLPKRYISWGAKSKKNLLPAFNFKTYGKNIKYNSAGKLVIIFPNVSNNMYHLYQYEHDIRRQVTQLFNVINRLNPEIKKNTIIKLKPYYKNNYFGTNYLILLQKLNIEIDFDSNHYDIISNARLTLFFYLSTGILENLNLNIPTLIFKENLNEITKEKVNKYFLLYKNQILFKDELKISKFINYNWNHLEVWWRDKKKQKIIKDFNKDYNNKPSFRNLNKLLNEMIDLSKNENKLS